MTPQAGDDLTCRFINTRNPLVDLAVTKTNTPGANGGVDQTADTVTSGETTVYTVTVVNNGPDAANGAVVSDNPDALGLSACSVTSATASGGAVAPLSPGSLLTGGVAIATFPSGGQVVFQVSCTVN